MDLERLNRWLMGRAVTPALLVICLLPAFWLGYAAAFNQLGANPAESMIRHTGDWTIRMLCVVLAVTPLHRLLNLPALVRQRRMLGLYVYFYAVLHLLCYAGFDMGLDVGDIARDIVKRPFILVGFSALLLLTPLALTSWDGAVRRLGARRWKILHRLVYLVAVLAVLHFFWMRAGKNNFAEVQVYASILGMLLGWRLWRAISGQRGRAAVGRPGVDAGLG